MSVQDWTVNWNDKTATHKDGLKLKFTPMEDFQREYDIPREPRQGRIGLANPQGWMRLVVDGLRTDRPQNVNDILPLLQEGQMAFMEEVSKHAS